MFIFSCTFQILIDFPIDLCTLYICVHSEFSFLPLRFRFGLIKHSREFRIKWSNEQRFFRFFFLRQYCDLSSGQNKIFLSNFCSCQYIHILSVFINTKKTKLKINYYGRTLISSKPNSTKWKKKFSNSEYILI